MGKWLFICCGLLLNGLNPALAKTETKIALVIGNSTYTHAGALANPANDAKAIAAQLRKIGFSHISLMLDQNYNEMRKAIRTFAKLARTSDIAIIYYAGHGLEMAGRNFLIPTDAKLASDADVDYEAIPMQQVMNSIEGARKTGILILDACRNNPFSSRMVRTRGLTRSVSRGLADIEPSRNMMVAYSAKHGTVAEDGIGENSPYTTALLKYMSVPNLDIQLMFRKVRDDVLKATSNRQQPFTYGSIGGTEIPLFSNSEIIDTSSSLSQKENEKPAILANSDIEIHVWDAVKDSHSTEMLQTYLHQYPNGHFNKIAALKIKMLQKNAVKKQSKSPKKSTQKTKTAHNSVKPTQPVQRTLSPSHQKLKYLKQAVRRAQSCQDKKCLCDKYGRLSALQYKLNTKNQCGFGWPVWHSNGRAHRTWCYGFLTAMPFVKSQLGKRNTKLARCLQ